MNIEKIRDSLERLNSLYDEKQNEPDIDNFQLSIYCKMAALELCGWLEEVHDELIKDILRSNQIPKEKIEEFEDMCIKEVYGLSYSKHFRLMLVNAIGFVGVVELEAKIQQIESLKSILNELHKYRNHLAHKQYLNYSEQNPINSQRKIDTPSVIKEKFNKIHPILAEIEKEICSFNLNTESKT